MKWMILSVSFLHESVFGLDCCCCLMVLGGLEAKAVEEEEFMRNATISGSDCVTSIDFDCRLE